MAFGLRQINAGTLDRRVRLHKQSVTYNEMNEPVETYPYTCSFWAMVRNQKSDEVFRSDAIRGTQITIFTIRYRANVALTDRIFHNGRFYKITGILERGRKETLDLVSEFIEGGV